MVNSQKVGGVAQIDLQIFAKIFAKLICEGKLRDLGFPILI